MMHRIFCFEVSCKTTTKANEAHKKVSVYVFLNATLSLLSIPQEHPFFFLEKHQKQRAHFIRDVGWYPELVFLSVVFSNSTNFTVVNLNSSVFEIYFVHQTFKSQFRDL